ncbi:MAG: ATP phosphoribosyltransferase regulatory subunit [Gammaproteobacteria bacterium RIFCSPLOWO2_02_FULL_61_13]|nr:MAG: ATP phosphoribosyltransferase regulatory subunit [Gammaproteobacteria bacterium RIFCSPLOWO2_02_FULL_61_13]
MGKNKHWLLPEGIEEVLPPDAARLEHLCRELLDLLATWGYELAMPPLAEFIEALLSGSGEDLDLQTFKVTDQLSGRLLGIRADMTPQVARIDAHYLRREVPTRLCYLGPVLQTLPAGPGGSRVPLQLGAELYGHAGPESDAEVLALCLRTLQLAGVHNVHMDLGHVGIYRSLIQHLQLDAAREAQLFDALQRKAAAEIEVFATQWSVTARLAEPMRALVELHGGPEVLGQARKKLRALGQPALECIDNLERIAALVTRQVKDASLFFDLAELRGYHYHTGMMFSCFVPEAGSGIAFGGRYDAIGAAFGRERPATGFSADVKRLFALGTQRVTKAAAILAPASELPALQELLDTLRSQGEAVIVQLPGQDGTAVDMGCDREIVLERGRWVVKRTGGK